MCTIYSLQARRTDMAFACGFWVTDAKTDLEQSRKVRCVLRQEKHFGRSARRSRSNYDSLDAKHRADIGILQCSTFFIQVYPGREYNFRAKARPIRPLTIHNARRVMEMQLPPINNRPATYTTIQPALRRFSQSPMCTG